MRIDHGGLEIAVPEQFLDGTDIVTLLQEGGGKAVTQGGSKACCLPPEASAMGAWRWGVNDLPQTMLIFSVRVM